MEYATHGWGVIPGSACDGARYTKGHTMEPVESLAAVLSSARTLRRARAVWSWWHLAPYGVLARVGEDFDVLHAPTWLATGREMCARPLCPVALSPSGASLLVTVGTRLRDQLVGVPGVEVTALGSVVPLPPTRMLGGRVSWWITPEQTRWSLGDPEGVRDALCAALDRAGRG